VIETIETNHLSTVQNVDSPLTKCYDEGLKVGEMNKAMMEKIEEHTLYIVQLSKDNKRLQEEVDALKKWGIPAGCPDTPRARGQAIEASWVYRVSP